MFGNGIPDTLPSGYGEDVQVDSFTETPGEIKDLEKFVKSADGVIVRDAPRGPNPELKRIPKSEDFISYPKRLKSTPWAPLPPYVGEEMGEIAGYTPYNRGEGVPIHMVAPKNKVQQKWKPMYSGANRNFGYAGAYGAVPDSPIPPGHVDRLWNSSVSKLAESLLKAGVAIDPAHKKGTMDDKLIGAVLLFQQKWNVTPGIKEDASLKLQENGIYDKATELALKKATGEDAPGGGMTGAQWVGVGEILKEGWSAWFADDESAGADVVSYDTTTYESAPKPIWPIVLAVGGIVTALGIVVWLRTKDNEGEDE